MKLLKKWASYRSALQWILALRLLSWSFLTPCNLRRSIQESGIGVGWFNGKIGSQRFKKLRKLKNKAVYMAPVACGGATDANSKLRADRLTY